MNESKPGVKRLVLLNTGRFDDAEIELDTCVGLIGRNNAGKTSAVSTLQFLYVASLNEMSFGGKSIDDTKRHYFPNANSYIIYECLSAEHGGYVCVGVRGLGAVRGFEFERFAYPGRYVREHYVTGDNEMRDADDTKARIFADTGLYRVLDKARDMSSLLCGQYDEAALNLSFVPLKDSGAQTMFSRLFKNVLFLRSMTQTDLKDTLVEVYKRALTQPVVNLRKTNEEQIARLERQREEIKLFGRVKPQVDKASEYAATIMRERKPLPNMYRRILVEKTRENAKWQTKLDEAKATLSTLDNERSELDQRRAQADEVYETAVSAASKRENEIDVIERLGNEFSEYVEEIENAALTALRDRENSLRNLLVRIEVEPVAILQSQLDANQQNHRLKQRQLDNFDRLSISVAAKGLGRDDAGRALSVLNRAIAEMPIDDFESFSEQVFVDDLSALAKGFNADGSFTGFGFTLSASALGELDIVDQASLSKAITELEDVISKLENRLEEAKEFETHKRELKTAVERREDQAMRIDLYNKWKVESETLPLLRRQAEVAEAERDKAKSELDAATRRGDSIAEDKASAERVVAECESKLERLRAIRVEPPDVDWSDQDTTDFSGESVFQLAESYNKRHNAASNAAQELSLSIRSIEVTLQDGLDGDTPSGKLDAIRQRISGLNTEAEAFEREWGSLLVSARSSIDNIVRDVRKLSDEVARLNRRLSRVTVSNLSGVNLNIIENTDVTDRYRRMLSDDLLIEDADRDESLRTLSELIRGQDGIINLQQMFGIQIEVRQDGDAKPLVFNSLDAIESNGTSIMIKLLINMILLSDMMKKDRHIFIPYYVDEAPTLDSVNFSQVVKVSNEMGFLPILAGTTTTSSAKLFYFVRYVGGKKSILERRARLRREPAALENEEPQNEQPA